MSLRCALVGHLNPILTRRALCCLLCRAAARARARTRPSTTTKSTGASPSCRWGPLPSLSSQLRPRFGWGALSPPLTRPASFASVRALLTYVCCSRQRGATGWATTVLLPGIAGDYKLCGSPKAGADYTDLGFAFVSVKPGVFVGFSGYLFCAPAWLSCAGCAWFSAFDATLPLWQCPWSPLRRLVVVAGTTRTTAPPESPLTAPLPVPRCVALTPCCRLGADSGGRSHWIVIACLLHRADHASLTCTVSNWRASGGGPSAGRPGAAGGIAHAHLTAPSSFYRPTCHGCRLVAAGSLIVLLALCVPSRWSYFWLHGFHSLLVCFLSGTAGVAFVWALQDKFLQNSVEWQDVGTNP